MKKVKQLCSQLCGQYRIRTGFRHLWQSSSTGQNWKEIWVPRKLEVKGWVTEWSGQRSAG